MNTQKYVTHRRDRKGDGREGGGVTRGSEGELEGIKESGGVIVWQLRH